MPEEPTAAGLKVMIRDRYCQPEWSTIFEVSNDIGHRHRGYCDALSMYMHATRKNNGGLHGFEIKTSREDFRGEIKDPDKSERFKRYCDRWWLVSPAADIVQNDLPAGWGHLSVHSGKLVVKVGAPKLKPKALTRGLVACMLRRANGGATLKEERDQILEDALEQSREERRAELESITTRFQNLESSLVNFQHHSGIRISEYTDGARLGDAVAAFMSIGSRHGAVQELWRRCDGFSKLAGSLKDEAQEIVNAAHIMGIILD